MEDKIKVKDILNVEIGEVLNFPSSRDYSKVIRRKVTEFTICALRTDNVHIRVGYTRGKTVYFCTIDRVLELNPQLQQKEIEVSSFIMEGVIQSELGDDSIFQECISLKGVTTPIGRPYYKITNSSGQPVKWYINN